MTTGEKKKPPVCFCLEGVMSKMGNLDASVKRTYSLSRYERENIGDRLRRESMAAKD